MNEKTRLTVEISAAIAVLGILIVLMRFDSFRFVGWESSIFIGIPVVIAIVRNIPLGELGLALREPLKDIKYFLLASLVFLPAFVVMFLVYEHFLKDADIVFKIPKNFHKVIAVHFLYFALPEEFLFRGYLQSRLSKLTSRTVGPPGLGLTLAAVISAALFAGAHVVFEASWFRLLVFFPGLVFGWLRHKTGSILACTLFHGTCNVTAITVSCMFTYSG